MCLCNILLEHFCVDTLKDQKKFDDIVRLNEENKKRFSMLCSLGPLQQKRELLFIVKCWFSIFRFRSNVLKTYFNKNDQRLAWWVLHQMVLRHCKISISISIWCCCCYLFVGGWYIRLYFLYFVDDWGVIIQRRSVFFFLLLLFALFQFHPHIYLFTFCTRSIFHDNNIYNDNNNSGFNGKFHFFVCLLFHSIFFFFFFITDMLSSSSASNSFD